MKIKVIYTEDIGILSSGKMLVKGHQKMVSIVNDSHNLKFNHAEKNMMFFRIFRFPRKDILHALTDAEGREVTITSAYIRVSLKCSDYVTETINCPGLCFMVHYEVKEQVKKPEGNVLNCYTITEKECKFVMEADKEEIIRLAEPYLIEIDAVNSKAAAAKYRECFNDWAHPLMLESVVEGLTEKQKREAAKIIQKMFQAA